MTTNHDRPTITMTALTEGLREGYEQRIEQLTNVVRSLTDRMAEREQLISELRAELRANETQAQSVERSLIRVKDIITKRLSEVRQSEAK